MMQVSVYIVHFINVDLARKEMICALYLQKCRSLMNFKKKFSGASDCVTGYDMDSIVLNF